MVISKETYRINGTIRLKYLLVDHIISSHVPTQSFEMHSLISQRHLRRSIVMSMSAFSCEDEPAPIFPSINH